MRSIASQHTGSICAHMAGKSGQKWPKLNFFSPKRRIKEKTGKRPRGRVSGVSARPSEPKPGARAGRGRGARARGPGGAVFRPRRRVLEPQSGRQRRRSGLPGGVNFRLNLQKIPTASRKPASGRFRRPQKS